jgi:hypothetical protein
MGLKTHWNIFGRLEKPHLTPKRIAIAAAALIVLVPLVVGVIWLWRVDLNAMARTRVIAFLEERFQSDVEIGSLSISVFPRVAVSVQKVTLRHRRRIDVPPLFAVEQITADATILGLLRSPKRVTRVHITGLTIQTPPKRERENPPEESREPRKSLENTVVIDEVTAADTLLRTLPRDPRKIAREFRIHDIVVRGFSFVEPASFRATLTNPKPVGEIASEGEFGPWNAEEPGDTPVKGTFHFSEADFSTLRGITGILSSQGKYAGVLNRLDVEGDTQTPDFALSVVGNPVPLWTHYVAVVDGTDGDTYLTRVDARLGNSVFVVEGEVIGRQGIPGRHIRLRSVSQEAWLGDLLRLTVKGPDVPMMGRADFRAMIDIPPRPGSSILDRLVVEGEFDVKEGHLTAANLQEKVDALSRSGQGQPQNETIQDVVSGLAGRFVLRDGTIAFSNLTFDVPGTTVRLAGNYNLRSEQLNFRGNLLLDAKLSKATTGAKSFFLRLANPFFGRNGGGSSVPIKVTGDRRKPDLSLNLLDDDSG